MASRQTIVLVEDNVDDAELTIRAIKKAGLKARVVHSLDGEDALDYLWARGKWSRRNLDEQPDVVLLDLKLPKIDGFEVLRQVRADSRTRLLPVVVVSSSDVDEDIVRSYELGANSYVRKAVDFSAADESMRQIGDYWLSVNEPPPRKAVG